MATTTASDFQIYDDLFHAGRTEVIRQQVNIFNEASGGALQLRVRDLQGNYAKESFYTESITDSRRDNTSTATVAATKLSDDEIVSVKLNRRQGPMQYTVDALKKKGQTAEQASIVLGQQSGRKQLQAYVARIATSIVPALKGVGTNDLVHDGTGSALTFSDISSGRRLFGDAWQDLNACLIHGQKFHDLFDDGLSNFKVENVAGVQIATGDIAGSMGLVFVVTDEPGLITTGTPDTYHTVLLPMGAAVVEESEPATMAQETITGQENITLEWQMEYAANLSLKGFKWDVTNGGANPTDATLGTGTNWDKAATDNKSLAGVVIDSD